MTKEEIRKAKRIRAYMLAKWNNDPEWENLVKYTRLRKECIEKIMKKYGDNEK